ncbi:MAG TPA: indolepyruvate ferredoxin oxidoreductase family protein [Acidimicrobiales bacterium]|nr:indolepyruvate ferredoxin oxidoreductase family protein [Acidimicrobiales bacterium]
MTTTGAAVPPSSSFTLADRYDATHGTVVLTGLQAIGRVLIDRQRLDAARGRATAGVVSGYPGSPLGGLDLTLHRADRVLRAHRIKHVPGVNEELAAAVVSGTQQPHVVGLRSGIEGVFGMWYGKSPGADRCGDVFKHGNFLGSHPLGGVLAVVGDDPAAKSSSLPSHSETIFYDAFMPVLVPGTTQELLDLGLAGLELSRFSGCWVGMTVLTNVADSVGSVEVGFDRLRLDHPEVIIEGRPWQHRQRLDLTATVLIDRERDLLEERHLGAQAFAVANGLNRIDGAIRDAWIGFVAAGKTYFDLRQALASLGFDGEQLERAGIRLLKLGMTYPLELSITRGFARGLERIVVVEEKREFIEVALRNLLYASTDRPIIIGKFDDDGRRFVPAHGELTADRVAPLLARELARRLDVRAPEPLPAPRRQPVDLQLVGRSAAYCSGCPHNRSTVLPEGAVVGGGVGCHGMSYFDARLATNPKLAVVPMGAEGVPWIGLADVSSTDHIFQQLGDGTFTHSGLLAIRACVAADVNITFKILYNGYVAMTGGQAIAGGLTVAAMTRELDAEGVKRIIVCTEDVDDYRGAHDLAPGVEVWHRDRVLDAQNALRAVPGVTVLVYDQVCAAEARRLRKRGALEMPPRQVVINELVCEGCGDCSTQSNCLSVQPVATELGRKTQIHQSSCNRDYSCLLGDCPSFVTVTPTKAPRVHAVAPRAAARDDVPDPPDEPSGKAQASDHAYGIYMVGIGGTGVVTVNQLLATAALLDGLHTAGLDQTGMSQKAGQVASHLQISTQPLDQRTAAVSAGEADAYLVFDVLSGASDAHLARVSPSRTTAVISTSAVPTASIVTDIAKTFPDIDVLVDRIDSSTSSERNRCVDAVALAESLFGDHLLANVLLLGVAYQAGVLPLSAASIERAIELNGVAVDANIAAFRQGRAFVNSPAPASPVESIRLGAVPFRPSAAASRTARRMLETAALPAEVRRVCEPRAADLIDYQNAALARRYTNFIATIAVRELAATGGTEISCAVARSLHKLLAYKDEYEVARLHLKTDVGATARAQLGVPVKVAYHLHPPMLRALGMRKKIAVGPWIRPMFRVLRAMRRVRGSAFDIFGRSQVRRVERALPGEYEAAVLAATAGLGDRDVDRARALEIAQAADIVRGYEHVKLANVERFRAVIAAS